MQYEINDKSTTISTTVTFTFDDGTIKEVVIQHFNPRDEEDIIKGIENRFITEQTLLNNQ